MRPDDRPPLIKAEEALRLTTGEEHRRLAEEALVRIDAEIRKAAAQGRTYVSFRLPYLFSDSSAIYKGSLGAPADACLVGGGNVVRETLTLAGYRVTLKGGYEERQFVDIWLELLISWAPEPERKAVVTS